MEIREEKNILMTSHIDLADFKAKGINNNDTQQNMNLKLNMKDINEIHLY